MRKSIASLLIATLLISACATTTKQPAGPPANVKEFVARAKKEALKGAIIGAAIGLAIGGGVGDDAWKYALAGGVAGALAGLAIGKHKDRVFAGRDHAIRETGYDSSQGYIARVEEVSFDPPQPRPGTKATLYIRYLVLGPNPSEKITVRLFRGLKYGENYVYGAGPNDFVIPRGGGVVESKVELTFPAKAPHGTYSIEALLEDPQKRFPQTIGTGALYIVAAGERTAEVMTAAP